MKTEPGFLVLENKKGIEPLIFAGECFGAPLKEPISTEAVFNTSMTGYQEILTDPSYAGQTITLTVPHVGNTGFNLEDDESTKIWADGLLVLDYQETPSNWRSHGTLSQFLEKHQITGLRGIDTRKLTLHLRTEGVTRGVLLREEHLPQASQLLRSLPKYEEKNWIAHVSTKKPYVFSDKGRYKVIALDFGVKTNMLRILKERDCAVEVYPWNTKAEEILAKKPDGVFLSNGPGDPALAVEAVECVRKLLGKVPIFGVCMGHQILSLAIGAKTYKLKFGHRGGNHPVKDLTENRVEITSQNHGYAVDAATIPAEATITHLSLNDRTVEGISLPEKRAFSVQYHPEASPGPKDSEALFDRFIDLMKNS